MKLNGDIPVEVRRHNASSKSLRDADRLTVSINVEFLDSCDFHCPGCFVSRRNSYTTEDLKVLNDLAKQFSENDFEVNEIILGPTDLFGCKNAEDVLSDPQFMKLFDHFQALTFNTTLQSDSKHIQRVMDIIKRYYPDTMYLEAFIVLDIDKFVSQDKEYLDLLETNLELIKDANIIFAFNIHNNDIFKSANYSKIAKEVNERYNSHLKMVPSFFRSQKTSIILENLQAWKEDVERNINSQESISILNNISDLQFGGHTYFVYTFKDGELYSNPCIYDFVFDRNDSLIVPKVDGRYQLDTLYNFETKNIIKQYMFAKQTEQCEQCMYLPSCASKNILTFMENRGIINCFLPKKTLDYCNRVENGINNQTN